jgi:L-methionine (R)-S-oxide reductase
MASWCWGRSKDSTAAARREPVLVPDVGAFPGHIACDGASRSELVVPLLRRGEPIGVLDLDSPRLARFDEADRDGCVALAGIFLASLDR